MGPSGAPPHRGSDAIVGIFVGGAGRRMGGVAKGLLRTEGETLVARLRRIAEAQGLACVLVGERSEYAALDLPVLGDAPPGIGPLGGLVALLRHAGTREALAVACDMPFVTEALLARLVEHPPAPAVAPRREGRWEPLFARYSPRLALPIAERRVREGAHGLQGLLDELAASELSLSTEDALTLRDWDTLADRRSS